MKKSLVIVTIFVLSAVGFGQGKQIKKPAEKTTNIFDRAAGQGFDLVFANFHDAFPTEELLLNSVTGQWKYARSSGHLVVTGTAKIEITGCGLNFHELRSGMRLFGTAAMCSEEPDGEARLVVGAGKGRKMIHLSYVEEADDEVVDDDEDTDSQEISPLAAEIVNSTKGLLWSTESDEPFKPLFIRADPGETIQQQLNGWAETLQKSYRPKCTECIDPLGDGTFEGFIRQQQDREPDENESPAERRHRVAESGRWTHLANVMQQHLTNLVVFRIGQSEDLHTVLVLCGYDSKKNVVGIWVKK